MDDTKNLDVSSQVFDQIPVFLEDAKYLIDVVDWVDIEDSFREHIRQDRIQIWPSLK